MMWLLLVLLRLGWTLVQQTGYIHPDEFFQSTEVIAGDLFNLDVERTWEFNSSMPIRSLALPYVVFAPGYILLQKLQSWGFTLQPWDIVISDVDITPNLLKLEGNVIQPDTLLLIPRLTCTIISIICDFLLASITRKLGLNSKPVLIAWCTSYITLVYLTRTLSNTLETFTFMLLLYFVVSSRVSPKQNQINYVFPITLTIITGFFTRPTFLMFAAIPYLFWLVDHWWKTSGFCRFFLLVIFKGVRSIFSTLFCLPFFVVFDSLYYDSIHVDDMEFVLYNLSTENVIRFCQKLTITPLNFIQYNIEADNLAEHGLHPHYTHAAVNGPLLFNVLILLGYFDILPTLVNTCTRSYSKAQSDRLFLVLCFLTPLVLLSVFPHQEPRFLLPLLIPLVILYGRRIFGPRRRFPLQFVWLMFNIFLSFIYGSVHQGGLTSSMKYIHSEINQNIQNKVPSNIIFFHTYMPPKHLLVLPENHDGVDIIDLKGADMKDLEKIIQHLGPVPLKSKSPKPHVNESKNEPKEADKIEYVSKGNVYVAVPSSLASNFCSETGNKKKWTFSKDASFHPHLSMEDSPDMSLVNCPVDAVIACQDCSRMTLQERLSLLFALDVYTVQYNK